MIQADARSRITPEDVQLVTQCLAEAQGTDLASAVSTLERMGIDEVLDANDIVERLLALPLPGPSASLLFYGLVRQALRAREITERRMADYCAALVREFGTGRRAYRIAGVDDQEHHYAVDILQDAAASQGARRFRAYVHLGNFTLWLAGLFPDRIAARQLRRGGPDLAYYEALGYRGYAAARDDRLADQHGLGDVYRIAADRFADVRHALTDVGTRLTGRAA